MSARKAGFASSKGARRAVKWGGIACLVAGARIVLGNLLHFALDGKPLDRAIAWQVGANIMPAFLIAAGIYMLRGRGKGWGAVAAALLALDLAFILSSGAAVMAKATAFAVTFVLLVLVLNGVRGAVALKDLLRDETERVFR